MTCKRHRQPLYDQLVDILIEKIDHEYQPGDLIPSERELAERFGLHDRLSGLQFRNLSILVGLCENKVAVRLLPID